MKTQTENATSISQENLDYYNRLVASNSKIERKGLNVPYTSVNGHMFSYLENDGSLGLRLPKELLEEFLKKYKTTLFKSYGIIKKEYALVPDRLLKNTKELKPYFDASFTYVLSLKPKVKKKNS
jgi:hypothetical protein